jgi:hypothetical protein
LGRYDAVLARTTRDFTTRWNCREGDCLLWLRRDPFAGANLHPQVIDLWSMIDGAYVTITNRWQDFPPWFDLHPVEVTGRLMPWMRTRVEAHDYPDQPIDGPNIWRAKSGDRIVWVGPPQLNRPHVDGVLAILDCCAAVAALGDHPDGPIAFMQFTQPTRPLRSALLRWRPSGAWDCLICSTRNGCWDER